MHSMTGFGSGKCIEDGREITIEIKTVNHRFLDINQKLPKFLSFLESGFREIISERLNRGHLELYISYKNQRDDAKTVEIDEALLAQYVEAFQKISQKYFSNIELTNSDILKMQGVLTVTEQDEDQQKVMDLAGKALNEALDNLIVMREAEGKNLYIDVKNRINNLKEMFNVIVNEAPNVPREYLEKMKARMCEILSDVDYDEARLLTEVAVFADKCNIDEEIARFKSHIMQFENAMEIDEPVGRKLDFTLQEINREINTIGSKANNAVITTSVMDIKAELEKIREQIQNIE